MRYAVAALTLLASLLLLGGCGQTGPLYLPEEQAQADGPTEPSDQPTDKQDQASDAS